MLICSSAQTGRYALEGVKLGEILLRRLVAKDVELHRKNKFSDLDNNIANTFSIDEQETESMDKQLCYPRVSVLRMT